MLLVIDLFNFQAARRSRPLQGRSRPNDPAKNENLFWFTYRPKSRHELKKPLSPSGFPEKKHVKRSQPSPPSEAACSKVFPVLAIRSQVYRGRSLTVKAEGARYPQRSRHGGCRTQIRPGRADSLLRKLSRLSAPADVSAELVEKRGRGLFPAQAESQAESQSEHRNQTSDKRL